jgi:hypothetical protein
MPNASELTAGQVMNKAAALLNDSARTVYDYTIQLPYLMMALQELREYFALNSIPVTQKTSTIINIPQGQTKIVYDDGIVSGPTLPDDFVEPLQLWERQAGIDPWIPMVRQSFLPHTLEGVETTQFIIYTWNNQEIEVLPANRNNDIKMDYILQLFPDIQDETSTINIVNAQSFLEYRTAGLCAEFIENNPTRAQGLNNNAGLAMDRVTGISSKSKQAIMTRRRPFRAGYKKRGWVT